MKYINSNIVCLMSLKHLSKKQVYEEIGIGSRRFDKCLLDAGEWKISELYAICKILNTDVVWLLTSKEKEKLNVCIRKNPSA